MSGFQMPLQHTLYNIKNTGHYIEKMSTHQRCPLIIMSLKTGYIADILMIIGVSSMIYMYLDERVDRIPLVYEPLEFWFVIWRR